jgi:hypothetical protein
MNMEVKKVRRRVKQDKRTAKRARRVGKIGERLGEMVLRKNGFANIRNVNKPKPNLPDRHNFPFADLYAEKDEKRFAISVKCRNKYEHNGTLNDRYKLGTNCDKNALKAEAELNADAAWLAITMEKETLCAYFGLLSDLNNNQRGIPMTVFL